MASALRRRASWWLVIVLLGAAFLSGWFVNLQRIDQIEVAGELGIEKLISRVKHELEAIDRARLEAKEAALFQLKSFDLEISFTVHYHTKAGVEGEYHFITVTAEQAVDQHRAHRLVLHMDAAQPQAGVTPAPAVPFRGAAPAQILGPVPPRKESRDD